MTSQQPPRASPAQGCSIARQVMADAVDFYLANGGPEEARRHLGSLVAELAALYADSTEAFREAMARISQAEREEQQRAREQQQEDMHAEMMKAMSDFRSGRHARPADAADTTPSILPPRLSTPRALLIWQRLQQEGYVDQNYQPRRLSRTEAAELADEMMTLLSTENERLMGFDEKWKPFETLWQRYNMRADHYRALSQEKAAAFKEKIHALLSGL